MSDAYTSPRPRRKTDSHEGQDRLVLVTGGSEDYVCAPALVGISAFRAGCGIVKIAAQEDAACIDALRGSV
jgi:NAD(P)H-hydrate repair Nnr-like enzyme with NAD(P)H-hydrate dehydratase domain